MKEKSKNKSRDAIFKKEQAIVEKTEKVKSRSKIPPDELMSEYQFICQKYEKLLSEMKKITRIGDVNYKKLLAANEQIENQKDELEILNRQLTEAKATQDKLYSIIAHDLRNPLQFLLFSSDVLYSDYTMMEQEEIHTYIGKIFITVQNMSDLLENLLQWSMSQYGKLECRPRPVNLDELVEETTTVFTENAEKKSICIQKRIPLHLRAYADEDMIKSVLRNLISNALKFTPSGGYVTISARETEHFIVTSIADTGLGIAGEKLDTLFKIGLNYTTAGTAKEKGTGLGLILCKELVEKNGGEIRVSSREGKGSCFEFSLPRSI
jgi:signal transduction histidine kinase